MSCHRDDAERETHFNSVALRKSRLPVSEIKQTTQIHLSVTAAQLSTPFSSPQGPARRVAAEARQPANHGAELPGGGSRLAEHPHGV